MATVQRAKLVQGSRRGGCHSLKNVQWRWQVYSRCSTLKTDRHAVLCILCLACARLNHSTMFEKLSLQSLLLWAEWSCRCHLLPWYWRGLSEDYTHCQSVHWVVFSHKTTRLLQTKLHQQPGWEFAAFCCSFTSLRICLHNITFSDLRHEEIQNRLTVFLARAWIENVTKGHILLLSIHRKHDAAKLAISRLQLYFWSNLHFFPWLNATITIKRQNLNNEISQIQNTEWQKNKCVCFATFW